MKDFQIRRLLRETELSKYYADTNSRVVEELGLKVAGARIDIAVINGSLHGYEIKSASDTLNRLPRQLIAYSYVFDYLTIITEETHSSEIKDMVPEWVGITICTTENDLKVLREPEFNLNKAGFHIAKLLWREELIQILIEKNIPFKRPQRNWLLCKLLEAMIDVEELSYIVREKLKKRTHWRDNKSS